MIVSALALASVVVSAAPADSNFTLVWSSGEMSRDASHQTSTWTLAGRTLTHDSDQSGGHLPPRTDTHTTIQVNDDDLKKLAAHLAEIDPLAAKYKGRDQHAQGRFTTVTFTRGKRTIEVYFPYWLDDEIHRPKNEKKEKLDLVEKIDGLRGKLVDIEG